MESANKAIIMAFGMLVAVMIMGTIAYVFTHLKVFPEDEDDIAETEQLAAFNTEYEVYDKKIMYGVDVISVLNKAQSNNDKYVQSNFFSGVGYNTDYIIDIEVRLKTALEESIVVTYLEQSATTITEYEYMNGQGPNIEAKDIFKVPSTIYRDLIYRIGQNWDGSGAFKLQSQTINTTISADTYHLLSGDSASIIPGSYTNDMIEGDSVLKSLLEQSAEMSQTVKNTSGNTMIAGTTIAGVFTIDEENTGWNKATWYPAIYDLKTRKFKSVADEIVYNETTGRITKMVFEEI